MKSSGALTTTGGTVVRPSRERHTQQPPPIPARPEERGVLADVADYDAVGDRGGVRARGRTAHQDQ